MLDQKIRVYWDKAMKPVGRFIGRTGLSPNAITFIGIVVQAVAAYFIVHGRLAVAGIVAIVGGLLDTFDGAVAKALGRTTKFGALLDSTTDRLADALLFGALVWLYGVDPDIPSRRSLLVAALALAALVFSFLVSYVKARAEGLGYEAKVGIAERAERLGILVIGLILDIIPIALGLLLAASVITLLQRLLHVRAQVLRDRH
ncbi:MAG: CDP-alcohol phosphatidyltransferase family protein [Actinomycetota bacterium]